MKINIFIWCALLLACSSKAEESKMDQVNEPFKNATIESCYAIGMSASVVGCMSTVAGENEQEYNKQYKGFVARNAENKEGFNNYAEFVYEAAEAKKYWDKYVEHECRASAYLAMKGSYAFNIYENACQAKLYAERAQFYKNYQDY